MKKGILIGGLLLLVILSGVWGKAKMVEAKPPAEGAPQTIGLRILPGLEIQQGRTLLVYVTGSTAVSRAQATFLEQSVVMYPTAEGEWVGFLAVDMNTAQGVYQLNVYVWEADNPNNTRITQDIAVVWGGFPSEEIGIPYALDDLLNPTLNDWEADYLNFIYYRNSAERLFTTFAPPVAGPVISSFGNFRNYNGNQLRGRHTGIDYRVNANVPVGATANGRVILAKRFPIRGNHVVIDHGWGIVSGYSHLNQIGVVPGQLVRQGETIGLVGSTGRSQGPHFHFEVSVNGHWIDPSQFLTLSLPAQVPPTPYE